MNRNKDSDSYIKYISVIDLIIKNSDEKNPITINQIQDLIYDKGYDFKIDFRIVKKFVENYNNYYEDTIIKTYKEGRNNYFYYENPNLDLMEAKAIIDLVYSSHFFTLKTKENYKKRMQDLFSIHNQAYFQKRLNLHVVKNENEQVFYQELEVITKAIKEKKKIRFEYQKPSLTFNKKHKLTELAPIDTVFSNNEYYLLCQGAKDPNTCIQYRLDYVKNVEIVKDSDVKFDDYQLNSFEKKLNNMTYMYGEGKIEVIELEFIPNVYSNMIDKFGKDIHPKKINENLYCVQVRHIINSTFYSWIIGFGGRIQIADNDVHKKQFKDFLIENFINKNNKVTLIFSKKDYNDYDFIEVIIKNTKNKEEFTCPFTINSSNSITIDLSDIYLYFTDYEGSISIVAKCDNTFFSITPILSKENLTIINDFQKTNYKLFIRTLENGELRLSSIIKKL